MKGDRRKIEIIMARKGKKGKDIKIPKSTMQNVLGGHNVQPYTLGKLARELGVDITEIIQDIEGGNTDGENGIGGMEMRLIDADLLKENILRWLKPS